ncbi:hypothetical protein [Streptomyces sp. NPDC056638]
MNDWTPEVTLTYLNDEGDEVEFTRTVTPETLTALIDAMEDGQPED